MNKGMHRNPRIKDKINNHNKEYQRDSKNKQIDSQTQHN
jgi:hypothetical protein